MSRDPEYLVCPACEHRERVAGEGQAEESEEAAGGDGTACPACGSRRAYRAHDPALPDAETEAYIKFDAESAAEE